MWVEDAQHSGDGALINLFVHVYRFGVVRLNDVKDRGEFAHGRLAVLRSRGCGSDRRSINPSKYGRCDQDGENDYEAATILVHSALTYQRFDALRYKSISRPTKKTGLTVSDTLSYDALEPRHGYIELLCLAFHIW